MHDYHYILLLDIMSPEKFLLIINTFIVQLMCNKMHIYFTDNTQFFKTSMHSAYMKKKNPVSEQNKLNIQ